MDNDSAEYEWFFFRKKYVFWESCRDTYLELAELIPQDKLLSDLVNILKEPVFSAEHAIKRHACLGLMAMMPLTTGVIKAIGSGMDDGSKYVVLQSLLLLTKLEIDDDELLLEALLPFLEKAKEIVQRDEKKADQTLRVAAAAVLVSHNLNCDVVEYCEIILRNIHPRNKFVMSLAIELGLQLQIIENEGDA